jgi:hypothetical protein
MGYIESKIMLPKFIKYIFTYQSKNERQLGLIFKMEDRQGSMCFIQSSISNHFIIPLLGGWISFTRHKKMEHNNFDLDSFVICTSESPVMEFFSVKKYVILNIIEFFFV